MAYNGNEVPLINEFYSQLADYENNRVICSSEGQIKVLNCEPNILFEVLSLIDGIRSFDEIESKLSNKYLLVEIREFLSTLLDEKILIVTSFSNMNNSIPSILVISDDEFWIRSDKYESISIKDFMSDSKLLKFDIAIVISTLSTYEDILTLNQKLYKIDKKFVIIRCNCENIAAGPLIIPGNSGCYECLVSMELKSLNKKLDSFERLKVIDLHRLQFSQGSSGEYSKFKYIFDFVVNDIIKFYNTRTSELLDYQYLFNLDNIKYEKNECLPTTQCNFCNAFNLNYVYFDPGHMHIEEIMERISKQQFKGLTKKPISYSTGGLRSVNEEETKKIVERDLKKLGIKTKVEPALGNPFNDSNIINCYNSTVEQTDSLELDFVIRKNEGAGKGSTREQSYFSAAFELLEHVSLQYTGDVPIICAKYADVKEYAIDVPKISGTIKNQNTIFDDFDESEYIDWVVASSVIDGHNKLVPAFMVFMFDVDLKGTLFPISSNGAGSAVVLEDAILHGLLEAVERDAWIIGQSNPFVLPVVDYETSKNSKIKDIISKIKEQGYDIITRDYTNDIGIPVYRTWIVNPNDYSRYAYTGLGCHVIPEIALERSITEAVQVDDWSTTGGINFDAGMMNLEVLSESLINIYNQHFLVNKDILGTTDRRTAILDSVIEVDSTLQVLLDTAKKVSEAVNGHVYYVDLTKPGLETKVVRTIITGDFQNMNIPLLSVSPRLFEFGKKFGYADKLTTYEELFMGEYQH